MSYVTSGLHSGQHLVPNDKVDDYARLRDLLFFGARAAVSQMGREHRARNALRDLVGETAGFGDFWDSRRLGERPRLVDACIALLILGTDPVVVLGILDQSPDKDP
jgi:hypothetical protein